MEKKAKANERCTLKNKLLVSTTPNPQSPFSEVSTAVILCLSRDILCIYKCIFF